jgi:site-specific DNA recombinase
VSSTRQKQNETIDSQVATLREHAIGQGWETPRSGSSSMMAGQGRLWCYAHQVLLIEEFTRCGTAVVFIHNPVATTPEQALMVQFQGMIAEYERALIAERTRRGKVHRARAGATSVLGRAPYGYRYLSKAEHGEAAYAVAEPEATVVARIFARYATGGVSMQALAKELSRDRIASPSGNPNWDAATLGRMLRNPAYAGRAAFGKTQTAADPPRANRTSRRQGRPASGRRQPRPGPARSGSRSRSPHWSAKRPSPWSNGAWPRTRSSLHATPRTPHC